MALSHQWRLQPPYSAATLNTSGLGVGCIGVFNGASETLVGMRLSAPSVRAAGRVTYSKGIATLYDNSLYTQFPPGAILSIQGPFTIGAWIHPTAFQLYSSIFDNSNSSTVNGLELRLGAGASGPTSAVPSLFKKNSGGYYEWAAGISPSVNTDNCIIYSSNGLLEDPGSFVVNNVETTSTTQGHTSTGMIAPSSNNFYVGTRADVYTKFTGGIYLVAVWCRILSAKEKADFYWNPWQIFAPIRRQFYFGVGAANIITVTVATRAAVLRNASGVATTKAATVAARAASLRGADTIAAIRSVAVIATAAKTRAADAVAPTKTAAIAARPALLRGTDTVAPTRSVTAATRAARISTADTATPSGITSVTVATRAAVLRGADAVDVTRAVTVATLAAKLRTTDNAAPVGVTSVTIAARVGQARGADAVSTTRALTIAARGRISGADAVAPTRSIAAATRAAVMRGRVVASNAAGTTVAVDMAASAGRVRTATLTLEHLTAAPRGTVGPLHRPTEARRAQQAAERRPPNRR